MLGRWPGNRRAGKVFQQLASALRAGDDETARAIAEREGVPSSLLTHWDLGPRGTLDLDDATTALRVVSALAAGVPAAPEELTETAVIDLVADAVEIVAEPGRLSPLACGPRLASCRRSVTRWSTSCARETGRGPLRARAGTR